MVSIGATNHPKIIIAELKGMIISLDAVPNLTPLTNKQIQNNILQINVILELTTKQKYNIRKRGKEYALNCSWNNRSDEWMKLISNDSIVGLLTKRILIFISLKFRLSNEQTNVVLID